jgi:hypothetical protein
MSTHATAPLALVPSASRADTITPTLKMRRPWSTNRYADRIAALYE